MMVAEEEEEEEEERSLHATRRGAATSASLFILVFGFKYECRRQIEAYPVMKQNRNVVSASPTTVGPP
jgi:hypothetical protein